MGLGETAAWTALIKLLDSDKLHRPSRPEIPKALDSGRSALYDWLNLVAWDVGQRKDNKFTSRLSRLMEV
jgi:hypothetical protein